MTNVPVVVTRPARERPAVNAGWFGRTADWVVAFIVVLSIGLDPAFPIWHAASSAVPPEFRTVSISASDVALLILIIYGWWTGRHDSTSPTHTTTRVIAWCGVILACCAGLSTLVARIPWLSVARLFEVVLGLLACVALAQRRSLAERVLVCGAGLILLQLPQVIIQEISQTSRSLGSILPGWSPVTDARVPGALVVFGPGALRWQRGMGSFAHPNLLGGFLALAIVFSLPWLARGGRRIPLLWLVWSIAWIELLLTFSRSALVAAVAGCVLCGVANVRHSSPVRRIAALVAVPAAAVAGMAIILGNVLVPRLDPAGVLHSTSVLDRWQLAGIGARVIAAHPVFGVGAGNFSLVEAQLPLPAMSVQPVHVVPLLVADEAGILAGFAWLGLVLAGPVVEWHAKRRDRRLLCERLAIPVVILTLASLDHYFWTSATGQALFWVSLGLWASASRPAPVREWRDMPCRGGRSPVTPEAEANPPP